MDQARLGIAMFALGLTVAGGFRTPASASVAEQIATWAGHTSVSVVLDRYGHLFPGHEEAVMRRLEEGYAMPTVPVPADVRTLPTAATRPRQ